jgi:hypothetical protein
MPVVRIRDVEVVTVLERLEVNEVLEAVVVIGRVLLEDELALGKAKREESFNTGKFSYPNEHYLPDAMVAYEGG